MYGDTLKAYCDDLAAKKPAPGGGSAAALAGALGASLLSMVANFTVGKPAFVSAEREVRECLEETERLRKELLAMVDRDAEAYLSKDLRACLQVPLEVCGLCLRAMRLCPVLVDKGNPNLISDVAVAAVLLECSFSSSRWNVEVNLKAINDEALAKELRSRLDSEESSVRKLREQTEVSSGKIIRG